MFYFVISVAADFHILITEINNLFSLYIYTLCNILEK